MELAHFVPLNSLDAQLALMDQLLLMENALVAMPLVIITVDQLQLFLAQLAQVTVKLAQLQDAPLVWLTPSIQPLPQQFHVQFVMLMLLDALMH